MNAGDVIYAVWSQTYDVYDNGQLVSFHATHAGAQLECDRLLSLGKDDRDRAYSANVIIVRLKD